MGKRNRTNAVPIEALRLRLPKVPDRTKLRVIKSSPQPNPKTPPDQDTDFMQAYADWRTQYPGGSLLEYIVWEYLVDQKHWENHNEFEYQWPVLGGRTKFGGFVVDFYIKLGKLVWNVQGLRYHLQNPKDRAQVQAQAAILTGRGFKVLSLWEDDLLYRTEYTMENALIGQEVQTHKDEVGIYV